MKKIKKKTILQITSNRKKLIRLGVDINDSFVIPLIYEVGQKQYIRFRTGDLLIGFKDKL